MGLEANSTLSYSDTFLHYCLLDCRHSQGCATEPHLGWWKPGTIHLYTDNDFGDNLGSTCREVRRPAWSDCQELKTAAMVNWTTETD